MSRIGKIPVQVPQDVQVTLTPDSVSVKGKLGELSTIVSSFVKVSHDAGLIVVNPINDSKEARMHWGTVRKNIANLVMGVTTGFEIKLEINGVGFRAAVQGSTLVLNLGFSHDIKFPIPKGVNVACEKNVVSFKGADLQLVSSTAAKVRAFKKPEPYKGKGIKYVGETIVRKEGKKK